MRKWTWMVIMAALLVSPGCVSSVRSKDGCSQGNASQCIQFGADPVVIREIDAIGKLHFERDKGELFRKIANRSNLGGMEQAYLIQKIFDTSLPESNKRDILITLIASRSFCERGKMEILDRVHRLLMEQMKVDILEAISSLQDVPPCPDDPSCPDC